MIWAEADDFTGWCCSHCTWGIAAPRLESTFAALAFNRLAQELLRSTSALMTWRLRWKHCGRNRNTPGTYPCPMRLLP